MLTIGEFSNICKVSTKTLRYYAKIGLLLPDKINPENGYRYYSIDQLETMLFIERLKSYNFSLEEIKVILNLGKLQNEKLYAALARKKKEVKEQIDKSNIILERLNEDMLCLQQGRSIMSYLENFDIELVEVSKMNLISVHKRVHENEFVEAYSTCFGELFKQIQIDNLNIIASPMVLFHDAEFSVLGLDTEFAIPVKEKTIATREFCPGLCLKTVLQGSYSNLPSIYAKHRKWIEEEGYMYRDALFEVYVTDGSIKSSIGGGGRYDKMITDFINDGKEYPAVGISFGLNVIYEILKNREEFTENALTDIFIIPMGTQIQCLKIAEIMRKAGYRVEVEMKTRKMKKSLEYANEENIPYVFILGEDELAQNNISVKNMKEKKQDIIGIDNIIENFEKIK